MQGIVIRAALEAISYARIPCVTSQLLMNTCSISLYTATGGGSCRSRLRGEGKDVDLFSAGSLVSLLPLHRTTIHSGSLEGES